MNASQCTFCSLSFVCTVRTAYVVHVKWQLQKWQAVKSWISRIVVPLCVLNSFFFLFEKQKYGSTYMSSEKSSLRTISGAHTIRDTRQKTATKQKTFFAHVHAIENNGR